VTDRLPYADVSIAAVLVAVGTALAAFPWLGVLSFALAAVIVVALFAVFSGPTSKGVTSGELPWT